LVQSTNAQKGNFKALVGNGNAYPCINKGGKCSIPASVSFEVFENKNEDKLWAIVADKNYTHTLFKNDITGQQLVYHFKIHSSATDADLYAYKMILEKKKKNYIFIGVKSRKFTKHSRLITLK
jgi:hypothetical protein